LIELSEDNAKDLETQLLKRVDKQRTYNHQTQNMDALYKLISFNMTLEQKSAEKIANKEKDPKAMFELDSFEIFYKD